MKPPVSIADSDLKITDDGTTLQSATITLTNAQANDVLLATGMPAGITATVSADGTTVTLSGTATLATYEAAIKAIQFNNTSDVPSSGDRTITVVVNDGQVSSNIGTTTVRVVPINDAPTLDLNGTAAGNDYATTFNGSRTAVAIAGTDVKITDVDERLDPDSWCNDSYHQCSGGRYPGGRQLAGWHQSRDL